MLITIIFILYSGIKPYGLSFSIVIILLLIISLFNKANTNIKSENLTRDIKYSDIKYPILTQLKLNRFKKEQKKIITIAATVCNQELIFINNMNAIWNSYLVTVWSLEEKKHIVDLLTPLQFIFIVVSRILFILIPTIIIASFFFFYYYKKRIILDFFNWNICNAYTNNNCAFFLRISQQLCQLIQMKNI